MKISQLMATLQGILDKHGDLDVVIPNQAADRVLAVQHVNVTPQAGWPWRSLIRPVLAFEPTDDYTVTPEESGGWSYDLNTAPHGDRVRIMKRRGGEDEGFFDGEHWYAYEGGDKAWQLAPGGIMAWRAK